MALHTVNTSWDMGYFTQATWLLSEGHDPYVTVRNLHLWGDHVYLALIPISWLAKIFPVAPLLIALQSAGLAAVVFPLQAFCRRVARLDNLAIWAVLVAYTLFPAVHNAAVPNVHPETITVGAFLVAIVAAHDKRWLVYASAIALVLISREDFALTVATLGVLVAFKHSRRAGIITSIVAAVWLVVQLLIVLPHFSDGYRHVALLDVYGQSTKDVVTFIVTKPWIVVGDLLSSDTGFFVWSLLLPVALLPIVRPVWLLPAIPLQILFLLSARSAAHTIFFHYTVQITPFVLAATASALKTIRLRRIAGIALVACSVIGFSEWATTNPLKSDATYQPFKRRDADANARIEALNFISDNSAVATNNEQLWTPLGRRKELHDLRTVLRKATKTPATANPGFVKLGFAGHADGVVLEWIIFDEAHRLASMTVAQDLQTISTFGYRKIFENRGLHVFLLAPTATPSV